MPIQRIVCFKFNKDASPEAVRQHLEDFAGMKDQISQIREYRGGLTHPGDDNRPADYESMHYLTFDSMEDIEIYRPHPAHLRFIERNKGIWDGVLVLNADY